MRLDLSTLQVPVEVPVVPVAQKPSREPDSWPENLVNQGFPQLVPVVPVVPVNFEKVHAKADQQAESEHEAADWWASYEAMATEDVPPRKQPPTNRHKSPQEQTIAEWVADYEAAEARYREIDL